MRQRETLGAIAAIVTPTHIVVANCGDSRAYLKRGKTVIRLSVDHKPDRPDETARIRAAGGFVSNGRVMHILAVSRALGDRDLKDAAATLEIPAYGAKRRNTDKIKEHPEEREELKWKHVKRTHSVPVGENSISVATHELLGRRI